MQFYILMIDYGQKPYNGIGPYGFESVVNPELTRRDIIDAIRDIEANPRGRSVAFVKFVDGNFIEDITADLIEEASQLEAA